MNEPKDVPARGVRPGIHLPGTIPLALNNPIAEGRGEIGRTISAFTIGNNNFRFRRSLAQMPEKSSYQRCLVENWNND
jgi:hypothetical protein